ncbi:twisted gastrulation protein homolog 1 isoform X1 [Pogona vitticeps]|nr:twisted gastrulation protein homolog 1 isoform X1 [Pogona vitticeps]
MGDLTMPSIIRCVTNAKNRRCWLRNETTCIPTCNVFERRIATNILLTESSTHILPARKMKLYYFMVPVLIILLFFFWIPSSMGCNKALCASDVSKCLIQELCQCRPGEGNCSCCKECMLCLGTLWDECCDCVGMCNPRNYSDTPPTSKSTVEELHEPIPSLFRALTEGDTQLSWNVVSFPVAEELSHHENLVSILETVNQPHHQNVSIPNNNVHASYSSEKERMCTVVYFDDCMSIHQCKVSCESMGASKYRWFHNACCECIGPECIDYGSKTVRCTNCMF